MVDNLKKEIDDAIKDFGLTSQYIPASSNEEKEYITISVSGKDVELDDLADIIEKIADKYCWQIDSSDWSTALHIFPTY